MCCHRVMAWGRPLGPSIGGSPVTLDPPFPLTPDSLDPYPHTCTQALNQHLMRNERGLHTCFLEFL